MAETFAATAAEENRSLNTPSQTDDRPRREAPVKNDMVVLEREPVVTAPAPSSLSLGEMLQHVPTGEPRHDRAQRPPRRDHSSRPPRDRRPPMRREAPPRSAPVIAPVPTESLSLADLQPRPAKPPLETPRPAPRPVSPPTPHQPTKLEPGQVIKV
jgi:hypothetical protein